MIGAGGELALVDVREELIFSQRHLLLARSIPLSRLELKFAQLVPRRSTRVVLCDDNDGLAERAAAVLMRNGYPDTLRSQWRRRCLGRGGLRVFSGVNVPSKAFGEISNTRTARRTSPLMSLRGSYATRPISSCSTAGRSMNIRGCRSRPASTSLAPSWCYRPRDRARGGDPVVVNCAGRTRSIIGAQSLINAGLPNKVVALRNGTMGYSLAGFACDSGKNHRAPEVSAKTLDWARQAAQKVAQDCGVEQIDPVRLEALRQDQQRTLYLFDVRDRANTPPAMSAVRFRHRADSWCRRPINMSERLARESSWSTTPKCVQR